MNRRTFVVAALAWVLVVTLGSGLVWAAISHAGDNVFGTATQPGDAGSPVVGEATQVAGGASDDPTDHASGDDRGQDDHGEHGDDHGGHHGSGGDDPGDQPTGDGQASGTSGGGGGASGGGSGGSGGSGGTGGTGGSGGSGDPDGSKTGDPSPDGPTPVADTWNGAAGTVKVECTGATIRLLSAFPNDGYRIEVGDNGPAQVEVEFENTSTERHTKVESFCSSGKPVFRVETESGSDDG